MSSDSYDFIIVGAGSAACLIASRLSQQLPHRRILVLEAGKHIRDDPKVQTPGRSVSLQGDPSYDWDYTSAPEPGLNGRRIKHPRGKLVGGTSAINSHSVVFPNREWQDGIARDLLSPDDRKNWTADSMEESYRRFWTNPAHVEEGSERITTSFPPEMDFLQTQWVRAFEDLGYPASQTGFIASNRGAVTVTNAIDDKIGERSHAGTAFLEAALKRGNVVLKTDVSVESITFVEEKDGTGKLVARGVNFTREGHRQLIQGKEIILSAGVFESPTILERSGIGPKEVLDAAGISVRRELPGVGENLQDHLNCSMSVETRDEVPTRDEGIRNPELQKASTLQYEQHRTGRLAEGGAYSFAFTPLQLFETASETRELESMVQECVQQERSPSLRAQYSLIQSAVESPVEATASTFMLRSQRNRDLDSMPPGTPSMVDGNFVTVVAMLAHPFSRGSCHISSTSPQSQPDIKFNYLSHQLDKEILARHLRLNERLIQTPVFAEMTKPNGKRLPRSHPYPVPSLDIAKGILPINSATNYHPCGTCAMMREELGGVVDGHLRVYGIANVRVCDASVLPVIPRGNILSAVYAFAEKAVDLIRRDTVS